MAAKRSIEPLLWLLFSAGGVLSALLMPILLLLFGLAFPQEFGGLEPTHYGRMRDVLFHPVSRVVLFLLCMLSLFHWAHRFRYTLYDGLQIKHLNGLINLCCYGGAIAGSVAALYLLW